MDDFADRWNEDEDKGVLEDAVDKAKKKAVVDAKKNEPQEEFKRAYEEGEPK